MDFRVGRYHLVLAILIVCLFSMSSLFADNNSALSFKIVHLINIDSKYQFVFKNPSDQLLSTTVLTPGIVNENFASLYLQHNSNIIIKGLTVSATDLETRDKSDFFPYTMTLTDAQGNPIAWVADEEGHGSGYAYIVRSTTVYRYRDTGGVIKFADFSIDLTDSEDVPAGSYEGSIMLMYVVI